MKRLSILWLVGLLALLLVACGSTEEKVNDSAETSSTTTDSSAQAATQAPPTEAPTEAPAAADSTSADSGHTAPATEDVGDKYADLEIITLLPMDAIPAINDPTFLTAEQADTQYLADELVMGVTFNGESRAYSIPYLSAHEIVNDEVGGVKIAVTW